MQNCFHSAFICRSSRCKKCHKKHNTLLHDDNSCGKQLTREQQQDNASTAQKSHASLDVAAARSNSIVSPSTSPEPDSQNLVLAMHKIYSHSSSRSRSRSDRHILLSTAIINVLDYHGQPIQTRAILDLNESSSNTSMRTTTFVQSNINDYKKQVTFLVVNEVTKNIPFASFDKTDLHI